MVSGEENGLKRRMMGKKWREGFWTDVIYIIPPVKRNLMNRVTLRSCVIGSEELIKLV